HELACFVEHREGTTPGPVAGRVNHADDDVPDGDLLSLRERFVRVVGIRRAVDRNRHAVLEREPPVPRDVVGMRVRLEHADEPRSCRSAASRYCSIRNAGSTTIASPRDSSPTRYDAQPRSSSTNCLQITAATVAV